MAAWIELNGVKSSAFSGVIVEEVTPFLLAQRKATRTAVSGHFGPVEQGAPTMDTASVSVKLLVYGAGRISAATNAAALAKWLKTAEKLRTWLNESKYCLGRIEDAVTMDRVSLRALRLSFKFTACPPCSFCVRSKQSGWEPGLTEAVPEQITADTETVSGTFTEVGRLPVMTDQGVHAPALYFAVTGAWTQLSIGGMVITQAYATPHTVYLDCDAQAAYRLDAGAKIPVPVAGNFPENDPAGIQIGGTAFSTTVRALLIERW